MIAANVLFKEKGKSYRSAMVPLNRAMRSSHKLSIVTIPLSVTARPQVAMQILTKGSDPQISPFR